MKKDKTRDVDFIQGDRKENYTQNLHNKTTKIIEGYFEVEKDGETRQYDAYRFLDLVLEAHYEACDQSETYAGKKRYLVQAKTVIKEYIRGNDLKRDYSKILDALEDQLLLLEAENEAGIFTHDALAKKKVIEKEEVAPESFDEIFTVPDWMKYIKALEIVDPPILKVLNRDNIRFTGSPKKHKGVLGAWVYDLQTMGKIKRGISRQQLAYVLNKEISDLDLGRDGKTIQNQSYLYDNNYKKELLEIIK